MSGHSHEDSFQVIKSEIGADLAGIIHVVPELSTHSRVNPSFRLYEMDADTFTLLDYVQYRLYVDEANKNGVAEWKVAYRFTTFFSVPNLDYYHFPRIVHRMNQDASFFKSFMDMFWAEGPRTPEFLENKGALSFISCRLLCSDLYEFNECAADDYVTMEYRVGYGILSKGLDPTWEYAYYP